MLIQFALTLVVLLGFCGLALDAGLLELKQLQMQNAADAGAKAAVYALAGGSAAWTVAARADTARNGFTDGVDGVSVPAPVHPTAGAYAGNNLALTVIVTQAVTPTFFSGARTIGAQATALAPAGECLYLISQASTSFSLDVTSSTVSAGCATYLGLNYNLDSHSTATGGLVNLYGNGHGSIGVLSPQPNFYAPQQADPLATLAPPTPGTCLQTNYQPTGANLVPGTYCGNTNLQNNATYRFASGTYIFTGLLNINNAIVTGNDVTLYIAQSGGFTNLNLSTVNLSAPTSGYYQGILFFFDRNIHSGQLILSLNNLAASSTLDGVIYAPGQQVQIINCPNPNGPQGVLRGNNSFGVVADRLQVQFSTVQFSSNTATGSAALGADGGLAQ